MKRICIIILTALLLLSGCGKKAPSVEQAAENAVTTGGERAETAEDSAWARALPAKSAPTDRETRVNRYAADGALLSYTVYSYDASGELLREMTYAPDGTVSREDYTYIYDYEYVNGYLTAKNARTAEGKLVYRYKYDREGREFKWILYDEQSVVRLWYVDTFDDHGNVATHTLYEPQAEPKLMNAREYDYDEQGNMTECRYVDGEGNVLNRFRYTYRYSESGQILEYTETDVGGSLLVNWYAYTYRDGNVATQVQYDAAGRAVIRSEFDYDAEGRLTWERIFASSGELTVIVEHLWES